MSTALDYTPFLNMTTTTTTAPLVIPSKLTLLKGLSTGSSHRKSMQYLPMDFCPGVYDVVCGKGGYAANHVGNKRFRVTVAIFLQRYANGMSSRTQKTAIVTDVVRLVRSQSPGGGFVKFDKDRQQWFEVGDHAARERVGQAFRDLLHDRYESSSASKRLKRQVAKEVLNSDDDSVFFAKKQPTQKEEEDLRRLSSSNVVLAKYVQFSKKSNKKRNNNTKPRCLVARGA